MAASFVLPYPLIHVQENLRSCYPSLLKQDCSVQKEYVLQTIYLSVTMIETKDPHSRKGFHIAHKNCVLFGLTGRLTSSHTHLGWGPPSSFFPINSSYQALNYSADRDTCLFSQDLSQRSAPKHTKQDARMLKRIPVKIEIANSASVVEWIAKTGTKAFIIPRQESSLHYAALRRACNRYRTPIPHEPGGFDMILLWQGWFKGLITGYIQHNFLWRFRSHFIVSSMRE